MSTNKRVEAAESEVLTASEFARFLQMLPDTVVKNMQASTKSELANKLYTIELERRKGLN